VIALDELKVPKELQPVVDEIVGITDSVAYLSSARRTPI
jgi:hypothetical protein